jgi:hypothetical protein
MKNIHTNLFFSGANCSATQLNDFGSKTTAAAATALLLTLLLSISGCIGVTGAPKSSTNQPATSNGATMSVAPASINFGSVPLGGTASQSVTISNSGTSSLTVTKASITATGIAITGTTLPLVIEGGKQSTFNVIYSPKAAGALSGQVAITSSISTTPSTVSLRGIGMASTAVLTSSASKLSFGSVTTGKTGVLSTIFTNAGNSNVTISKVTVAGTDYTASGVSVGMILTPGQSATLESTFAPRAAGSYTGRVTVVSTATDSPSTVTLSGTSAAVSSSQQPATAHSVSVTWTPSTSGVAGYNVYRSAVSGGPYAKLDSSVLAADAFTDTTVSAGQTYYYVVRAATSAGVESVDSTQVAVSVPTP